MVRGQIQVVKEEVDVPGVQNTVRLEVNEGGLTLLVMEWLTLSTVTYDPASFVGLGAVFASPLCRSDPDRVSETGNGVAVDGCPWGLGVPVLIVEG